MGLDKFVTNIQDDQYYTVDDFYTVMGDCCDFETKTHRHKDENGEYVNDYIYNVPAAFDTEATSWTRKFGNKVIKYGTMYIWQFGINGHVFVGRTWDEFRAFLDLLTEFLGLNEHTFLYVYVHNLAFDFQFFRKQIEIKKVFALDDRRPVKVMTGYNIEFRCSYILTGKSLKSVGEDLLKIKIKKLSGDLDYKLLRHSETPLTPKEMAYCLNDVRVIMAHLYERFDRGETIEQILLTKTSYVRKYVREHTTGKKNPNAAQYRKLMKKLTLDPFEYRQAREAFSGGFTHANPAYVDQTLNNVDSIDFTSSYPAVMLCEKFPMTKGKYIKTPADKDIDKYIKSGKYLSHFVATFYNLEQKPTVPDAILSLSKCQTLDGKQYPSYLGVINNGRVVIAYEPITTTITDVDYKNMEKFYNFDRVEISELWYYTPGYLPKEFLDCVVHFYKQKTTLKGVTGKEFEYQLNKEMVNSCYGMAVTALDRDVISYDYDEWQPREAPDLVQLCEILEKYNNSPSRFLSYLWGVWVTAYARRNLFTGILSLNNPDAPEASDFIYSDTDSIKLLNIADHMDYINNYNNWIDKKLAAICTAYGYTIDDIAPKDIKGNRHPLGHWDIETDGDPYTHFKTLGAKRYLTHQNKKGYNMTVAGVPKFSGHYDNNNKPINTVDRLVTKYGDQLFDRFNSDFEITADDVNKICLTYIDEEYNDIPLTDYLGNTMNVSERSFIHMENIGYQFSRSDDFADFLLGIQQIEL